MNDLQKNKTAVPGMSVDYALIFNGISNSMAFTEFLTGRIVDVNQRWIASTGISREAAIGSTAYELGLWASTVERDACMTELEKAGGVEDFQADLVMKAGTRPHILSGQVLDMGGVPHVLWEFRDISERLRTEAALRASNELLRSVIENVPVRAFWKDRDLHYLGCNTAFARDAGRGEPAELVGATDFDMGWKEQAELYRADDRAVMDSGRPRLHFEEPQTTPDGQTIWLRTSKVPLRGGGGEVIGVLGMYEDISEVRRNAEELDRHRHHLEQLVAERTVSLETATNRLLDTQFAMESVGIGIHWVDFESGRFIYANRYSAEFLGYTPEEMLGLTVFDIDPHYPITRFHETREIIRQKGYLQFDTEQITRDGRRVPVEMAVYFSDGRDHTGPKLIGFMSDISRRKEVEQALVRAREAAESANAAKSAFLANMSHEIRTPLNAILGLNQLMRGDDQPSGQMERLVKMEIAGRHLLSLINDILDLSKIEAGRLEMESGNFHLSAILDNVASIIRESAQNKGLKLELDPDGVPLWLRGDVTRLRQSMLNFASNAVKFTERGTVSLRARLLEEQDGRLLVRFEVADSGIGLSPEARSRLFTPFQQADGSTARKYGGTGLGLALTKRLVELMGGEVGLDSTPGIGSTFWFVVPLQRGHGPMPKQLVDDPTVSVEALLRRAHTGARILLTEDNLINVEVVQEMLNAVGLDVCVALNGREAVEMARQTRFDLIFMDIQMPVMDGLEATRNLRTLRDYGAVPIVALTANAFAEDRRACLESGMNDSLTKPVEAEALYAALMKWLPAGAGGAAAPSKPVNAPAPSENRSGEDVLALLRQYPDINVDQGLGMVRGRVERYLGLLRQFLDLHIGDMGVLRDGLPQRDREAARRLAHTLKGAASTLGLCRIGEAATALDTLLREEDSPSHRSGEIALLADEIESALQTFAQALKTAGGS